jgi:hypothetical protein
MPTHPELVEGSPTKIEKNLPYICGFFKKQAEVNIMPEKRKNIYYPE